MPSTTPDFKMDTGVTVSGAAASTIDSGSAPRADSIGSTSPADGSGTAVCIATAGAAWPRRLRFGQKESKFLMRSEWPFGRMAASRRGTDRPAAAPFNWRTETTFLASATSSSLRTGLGRIDTSLASTTGALSSRNRLGNFSRSRSASCAAGVARAGATGDCSGSTAGPTTTFEGTGMAGSAEVSPATLPSVTSGTSDRTELTTGRLAIAFSIFLSCCSTNASPTKIRPPTTATAPGVITAGSKVWSWIETPEPTRAMPAATMAVPTINNDTYIRIHPDRTHGVPTSVTILAAR